MKSKLEMKRRLLDVKRLTLLFKGGLVLSGLLVGFTVFNRYVSDRIAVTELAIYIEDENINVESGYKPRVERKFFTNIYIYKLQTNEGVHELLFYIDCLGGFERHRMVFDKLGNRK